MIKISEYLFKDIEKYKNAYKSCDKQQKAYYKNYLKKYEWQFEEKKDFLKWYLQIVN